MEYMFDSPELDYGYDPHRAYRITPDVSRAVDKLHTHPFVQLWYVREGSYRHHYLGRDFLLNKGALLIVPPHCPHYIDTRTDSHLVRCEFSKEFISCGQDETLKRSMFDLIYLDPVLVAANTIKPYHYFTGDAAGEIEDIFDILVREYEKRDEFSAAFVRTEIARLFAVIGREYRLSQRDKVFSDYRRALDRAISYINANYAKKISIDTVCKIALMSERSFFCLFKAVTGMSPSRYLQYMRILQAKELLQQTQRTQYDIAKSCGFQSVSYFHRVFVKIVGMSPGQYRAKSCKE